MAQQNEDEIEDEAPSVIDLPAVEEDSSDRRRSMSEPADFFEFRMPDFDSSSYTFSWNDLIWPSTSSAAQLWPLTSAATHLHESPTSMLLSPSTVVSPPRTIKTRRSESLNESKIATQFLKSPCFRASRSLDYCRLRRIPSTNQPIRNNSADRANSKAQGRSPPWYWLMFGPLKFPQVSETEVRRISKSRQNRPPATLFPATEKGSGDRRGWRLISVLSCKSHASVAVTTPFQPYC